MPAVLQKRSGLMAPMLPYGLVLTGSARLAALTAIQVRVSVYSMDYEVWSMEYVPGHACTA